MPWGIMKSVVLACAVVVIAAGAFAAARPVPVVVATAAPAEPHRVLGRVGIVLETRLPGQSIAEAIAPALATEARIRYGRAAETVFVTEAELLPDGHSLSASGLAIELD